jgi:hypothetical protein
MNNSETQKSLTSNNEIPKHNNALEEKVQISKNSRNKKIRSRKYSRSR